MQTPNGKTVVFHFTDAALIGSEEQMPQAMREELLAAIDQAEEADTVHILVESNWESVGSVHPDKVEELEAELPDIQAIEAEQHKVLSSLRAAVAKDCQHCAATECSRRTVPYTGPYPVVPAFLEE